MFIMRIAALMMELNAVVEAIYSNPYIKQNPAARSVVRTGISSFGLIWFQYEEKGRPFWSY